MVTIRGRFWLDGVVLQLSGLRAGRTYNFNGRRSDGHVSMTFTLTGPVTPGTTRFRPEGGLAGQVGKASGMLSVTKAGDGGSLDVSNGLGTLKINGHWSCAAQQPTVSATLPLLYYATSAPVVGECWEPGQYSSDGDGTPVSCANGDVNVWAWSDDTYPGTLAELGPRATSAQVRSALCQLIEAGQETDTLDSDYQIVQAYYGWQLGINAERLITTNECQ